MYMVAAIMLLNTKNVSQRYSVEIAPAANAGEGCRANKINDKLLKLPAKFLFKLTNFVIPAQAGI